MLRDVSLHSTNARLRQIGRRVRPALWRVSHPGIVVGTRVRIGSGCRLFLDPRARLVLGDGCEIDDGTTIAVYGSGVIELGQGAFVGHHSTLAARDSIRLGDGAFLAELVSVRDHDHEVGFPPSSGQMTVEPVAIGSGAWLGAKVTVVKGSSIGDETVVGANAVVRGELPSQTICAGIPARVIRPIEARSESESGRSIA